MSKDSPQGTTVLLGVCGCIAAYKGAEIVRALQKAGVRVKVVMTEHSQEFVGPATFRALTSEPVACGLFDAPGDPIHHVSLAKEADVFLIAPATANVIAKIACGIADDILTTTALATTAPLLIAPAMNEHMYANPATLNNMQVLKSRGVRFIEPGDGYLACGDIGKGRLADIPDIVSSTLAALDAKRDLAGARVMITAGPTVEQIDPVRYLSNYSSGKMGFALARSALARGAEVTLISGPVSLDAPDGATLVAVKSAREMLTAATSCFGACDIAIFTAAVCDVRPLSPSSYKLKKGAKDGRLEAIALTENPDILATLAAGKHPGQVVVGFAAETENVAENGKEKLFAKQADFIVANLVGDGVGFGEDMSKAWLVDKSGIVDVPETTKSELAGMILDKAAALRGN
ncbi:MAG: bifunctional phosphopantothenoylcysteine decarboxylase/phosphopantothenate--cysteine ligase CoaBC [Eggerthellaceae bacterium]|nr:bifunctional phosphopantothenoylcysteine decarboxylase/phosphopantothenate--cysteine ligase CoaBC [Eggerthellaceae bacterium]